MAGLFLIPMGKPSTEPVATNEGATAGGNTSVLALFGLNITASDYDGLSLDNNLFLRVMTEWNKNPDPYLQAFWDNMQSKGLPANQYDQSSFSSWTGRYTIIAVEGDSNMASGRASSNYIAINIDGTYKNCNAAFFYEPGILMGQNDTDYDEGLAVYRSFYNARYRPFVIGGWNLSQYCSNSGTFSSTAAMANGLYFMGKDIRSKLIESGYAGEVRYNGGDTLQSAMDAGNFALGIYYYAQSLFASGVKKAGYCTGISIDNSGVITVTNSYTPNYRYSQYLDGIATCATTNKTYDSYSALKADVDLIIMDTSQLTNAQSALLVQQNIKLVNSSAVTPLTPLNLTDQRPENMLGVPYFFGLLYEYIEEHGLSEYDMTAYFIEQIYHVNMTDTETALAAFIGDGCGDAYNGYTGLTQSYLTWVNYMISNGANYYRSEFLGSGNWAAIDNGDF